jgi:ATP-dependent DNA helicase RecQ
VENLFLREPLDVTIESQKFLSCVARFQQRKELFGIDYTIQFLCGSCHLEEGHNELSTYGIGRDKEKIFWETLCSILLTNNFVENNYIQIAEGHKRPVLNLNDSSWEILKGNISVVVVINVREETIMITKNHPWISMATISHKETPLWIHMIHMQKK